MVAQSQVSIAGTATRGDDALLRRALVGDAIFSGIAGTLMIVASSRISDFTGITPAWALAAIGAGVLLWAADLVWMARPEQLNPAFAKVVIGGNVAWVVASYIVILGGWLDLTTAGAWTVGILAEIVALFAVVQYLGLRRLRS